MKYSLAVALSLVSTSVLASDIAVPEMSAGAGVAAVALLAGVAAIIREKMKK